MGKIGVLIDDGAKVECHVCGAWFRGLGNHVWGAHDLTADEYRAIFGLAWDTGLVGPMLRESISRRAIARQAWLNIPQIEWTSEQRRYWRKRQSLAAEAKARMAAGTRARVTRYACVICGELFTRVDRGAHVKTCSDVCSIELRARVNRRRGDAKRLPEVVTRCEICGTAVRVNRWRYEHKLAGRTCCAAHARVLAARTRAQQPDPITLGARGEPKPCDICHRLAKPLRRGRCHACNEYYRRHGSDSRPARRSEVSANRKRIPRIPTNVSSPV
jgi:hypothetical protein